MNPFVYDIGTKIYFGENQMGNLAKELGNYGKRVLMVYGGGSIKRNGLYQEIMDAVSGTGLEIFELSGVAANPKMEVIRKGVDLCKKQNIEVLLAVGGGSTIDSTKLIAAGAFVDDDPWELVIHRAEKPIQKALPIITILTLAATGSEMDNIGVISNTETKDKLAIVSPHLLPKASFLNPKNTYSVNAYQTASGSADILSHVIETYFNMEPGMFMLDCFMEGLMKTVLKYAPIAIKEPDNYEARANLMWASSWAINGAMYGGRKLPWSCHAMEHQVSAVYDITHGLGLAIITPRWMEYCLDETTVSKYVQFGVNVFGIDSELPRFEIAHQAIQKLSEFLFDTLGLKKTFTELGIGTESFSVMASKACGGGVLNGFKPLNQADIEKIFSMCL